MHPVLSPRPWIGDRLMLQTYVLAAPLLHYFFASYGALSLLRTNWIGKLMEGHAINRTDERMLGGVAVS
jgi:hypothetical protein